MSLTDFMFSFKEKGIIQIKGTLFIRTFVLCMFIEGKTNQQKTCSIKMH